jgi:hypothetical protein
LFAGASVFGLLHVLQSVNVYTVSILTFLAVGITEAIGGGLYLKIKSAKSADKSIHRNSEKDE